MSKQNEEGGTSPRRPWMIYVYIALTIVIVSSGLNWLEGLRVQEQKDVIQNNSAVQTQTNLESDICKTTPTEPLCEVARQIKENPLKPIQGPKGDKGEQGERGLQGPAGLDGSIITGMDCNSGTLSLRYTSNGQSRTVSTDVVCALPTQ